MNKLLFMMIMTLASVTHAADRPNVLFVICDDLSTTALSCYGNKVCKTPNIDRLASMGVRFERAYCQWPLCLPSRNSFLSGKRPTGTFSTDGFLRDRVKDVEFLPERFRKAGYFTGRVGKLFHARTVYKGMPNMEDRQCWDLSEVGGTEHDPCGYAVQYSSIPKALPAHPEIQKTVLEHELLNRAGGPGYDYWMEYAKLNVEDDQVVDGNIAKRISTLLDEKSKGDKPFFLAAGFRRPHLLWVAPQKYFDMYDWRNIELPHQHPDDLADIPAAALTRRAPNMSDEQRKKAIASYYACVSMVDANLGKLMEAMDRNKLWHNTIVIFTADHGWHLGEHESLWGKVTLFEESAKVPLIIVAPGMSKGTSPRTVEMLDFYPTLCELAGVAPTQSKIDGTSIVPQLRDPQAPREKPAFSIVRHGKTFGRAVYTEQFRYTEWGDNADKGVELYDHVGDPKEYTNVAKDPGHAETIKELKALLDTNVHVSDSEKEDVSEDKS
jgi:iduronate 2-sulfatase